ncbi:MAG: RNA polymerase sigma factor [Planctomycetota bacterium]
MMAEVDSKKNEQPEALTQRLLAHLRCGEVEAAELLEQGYRSALIRFCWGYLGDTEWAEDAVQEIFFIVLKSPSVPDAFRSWLYKIARNQCFNMLRQRARRPDAGRLPAASQVDAELTGQLTGLVRAEAVDRLQGWIGQLSDAQREVLRLRYVEDLSRGEIGEVLDIPEPAVKSRLFEALKKLRDLAGEVETF